MATVTISPRGQVTLPKSVRDFLHVRPGDSIDVGIDDRGRVVVRQAEDVPAARRDVRELRGLLKRPGRRPVTLAQMDAAIARHHRTRS